MLALSPFHVWSAFLFTPVPPRPGPWPDSTLASTPPAPRLATGGWLAYACFPAVLYHTTSVARALRPDARRSTHCQSAEDNSLSTRTRVTRSSLSPALHCRRAAWPPAIVHCCFAGALASKSQPVGFLQFPDPFKIRNSLYLTYVVCYNHCRIAIAFTVLVLTATAAQSSVSLWCIATAISVRVLSVFCASADCS